jgi:hypothetical protein
MEFIDLLSTKDAKELWKPWFFRYSAGYEKETFDFNFSVMNSSNKRITNERRNYQYMNSLQILLEIGFSNFKYENTEKPKKKNKIEMWHFIAQCCPAMFEAIVAKMKFHKEKSDDMKNIKKSIVVEYFAKKVNKQIDLRKKNDTVFETYCSKLHKISKTALYAWRFDLPDNDINNELVRFRIAADRIVEYGTSDTEFPLEIVCPTVLNMRKTYDKFVKQSLKNVKIPTDLCTIIASYITIY